MVITVPDEELGPIRMQGVASKLSQTPGQVEHAGQPMGASNDLVYGQWLGMSREEIDALRRRVSCDPSDRSGFAFVQGIASSR